MFFFVDMFVLCTINERQYDNREWYDTVEYRFGINAETQSDAIRLASKAAAHAIGRDGKYIGGIVKKAHATLATAAEMTDLLEYCFLPIENLGIFYVTGVSYSSVSYGEYPNDFLRHQHLARMIEKSGFPNPTFRHPDVDTTYYPRVCRLLCIQCEQWVEFDQGAFIFAFFSGIAGMPDEFDRLKSARKIHDSFSDQHAQCLSMDDAALKYINESDEQFSRLDPKHCVASDPRIA